MAKVDFSYKNYIDEFMTENSLTKSDIATMTGMSALDVDRRYFRGAVPASNQLELIEQLKAYMAAHTNDEE
jgi:hypothetical protein